jgi:hypothetical protein
MEGNENGARGEVYVKGNRAETVVEGSYFTALPVA